MKVAFSIREINCVIQKIIDMTVFQLVGFAIILLDQRNDFGAKVPEIGLVVNNGPVLVLETMIGTVNDMSDIYWSYNKVDCESPFYDAIHPAASKFYERASAVQPYTRITDIEGLMLKYYYFICDLYCRMAFLQQNGEFDEDEAYKNSFYRHKILALKNLDQKNFNVSCLCEVVKVAWKCLNR